ncbi:MAG: nuclear transport factor 2 family protein [Rhodocyclaceae bacterium]|nr:nuclear transport factor 2 family protein [Rhodocyclaceae bacterium]MBX3668764.1 nuclear transport factor 2 family protein [Rhodocyclaceae bacterium]
MFPFRFAFFLCLLASVPAFAVPAGATEPAERYATVWRMAGEVTASSTDGQRKRALRPGDAVYVGERVRAADNADAVLKTADAGYVAIRPRAEFVTESYAARGRGDDHFSLRLVSGALRLITGWIGHINRPGQRILTSTATIGVRGTDHEPYVLADDLAVSFNQKAGTYDKVNRGGTTLEAGGKVLDIEPGKVGFVRAGSSMRTRGLMTLLLPVLLDKVPDFYVPGRFDAELDALAADAGDEAMRQLEHRRATPVAESAPEAVTAAPAAAEPAPATAVAAPAAAAAEVCAGSEQARLWLRRFDHAIARRDARAVLRLFAQEFKVHANVRAADGSVSGLDFDREQFVDSTLSALRDLSDYRVRRPTVEVAPLEAGNCRRLQVRSLAIEQGRRAGEPYRFESIERYVLERRNGRWVAVEAEVTQR